MSHEPLAGVVAGRARTLIKKEIAFFPVYTDYVLITLVPCFYGSRNKNGIENVK